MYDVIYVGTTTARRGTAKADVDMMTRADGRADEETTEKVKVTQQPSLRTRVITPSPDEDLPLTARWSAL